MFEGTHSRLYLSDFSVINTTVRMIYAIKDKAPGLVLSKTVFRFDDGNLMERFFFSFELPHPSYIEPVHERLGISNLL